MKKTILITLFYISSFSYAQSLECGLFMNKFDNEPEVRMKIDLTDFRIYKSVISNDGTTSMSFTGENTEYSKFTFGIYRGADYDSIIISRDLIIDMKVGRSFALLSNGEKEDESTAICYKGLAPF